MQVLFRICKSLSPKWFCGFSLEFVRLKWFWAMQWQRKVEMIWVRRVSFNHTSIVIFFMLSLQKASQNCKFSYLIAFDRNSRKSINKWRMQLLVLYNDSSWTLFSAIDPCLLLKGCCIRFGQKMLFNWFIYDINCDIFGCTHVPTSWAFLILFYGFQGAKYSCRSFWSIVSG